MLNKRLMKEKQAWNSLGKKTAADIALSLKYNDLKHKEIQTSQSKQNSPARQFFNYFIKLQEILTDSCLSFQYAAWALRGPQGTPARWLPRQGPQARTRLCVWNSPPWVSVGPLPPPSPGQVSPFRLPQSLVSRKSSFQSERMARPIFFHI